MNRIKEMVIRKLIKVIDSMEKLEHMTGVRNYGRRFILPTIWTPKQGVDRNLL